MFNHKPNEKNKAFAFSLAEVLITLGIIGVVAAITIAIISNNLGTAQKSAGIKKALNTLTNAYNAATQENGVNFACSYITPSYSTIGSECNNLWRALKTKLNTSKTCDYNAGANYFGDCLPPNGIEDSGLRGGCNGFQKSFQQITYSMTLQDGTYLFMYGGFAYPLYAYDINGFKGPNKFGEDVFDFWILDNKIIPATAGITCVTGNPAADYVTGVK